MQKKYQNLFLILNHQFNNLNLLEEAFTHNSMAKKHRTYQRLEFLGDRVLALSVAEMLYERFPKEQEGALAKRHAFLVCEEVLADVARQIRISDYLIVSASEKINLDNPAMLADSCEALIGAIFLDAGFDKAREFVANYWGDKIMHQNVPPIDGKSALQEWAQARGLELPHYNVVDIKGAQHSPEFILEVSVDTIMEIGNGCAKTKKMAEQIAAKDLLRKLKK